MDVPEEWKLMPLAEAATVYDCKHRTAVYQDSGFAVVRPRNVREGILDTADCARTSKAEFDDLTSHYRPQNGDVIYSRNGSYGVAALVHDDTGFALGQDVCGIRGDQVGGAFLHYMLNSPIVKQQVLTVASGSTFKRINLKTIRALDISVPPLPEQRKIAAILSSVDEAIEKTQVVIDRAQEVKKGLMQELLTKGLPGRHKTFKQTEIGQIPEAWKVATIEQLSQLVTSGSRGWAKYYSDTGALFIRSQNVRSGHFSWADRQHVQPPSGAEGKRTAISTGDILVTITGNSVGNVASAQASLGEAYISQHVGMIRLQDSGLSRMIEYWLEPGAPGNRQILEAQYGQSKPGLNLKNLRSLIVPLPPTDEMRSIVERLDQTRERIEAEQRCAVKLTRLKSALMSTLLTGELRVRPSPEPA